MGSTFQAAPPLSNHKCHQPLLSVQPGRHPAPVPSIQASPRSPGRGRTGYAAGCLTSSHFLFGFKKQNRGSQTASPGAVQPAHAPMARMGGSAQAPLCRSPSQTRCRADAAAEVSLEGTCADTSQPSGNMPKPWHSALARGDGSQPSVCKCSTLDLVFCASAGKSNEWHFLLRTDLLSQIKRAILGRELRHGQQQCEDMDKPLQVALGDQSEQRAAHKTQEHQKGLRKKVLKT